jgi:hypothetical protein
MEGESAMTTSQQKISMKRAAPGSPSTHHRLPTRPAVLALALVALIAVSVLPGYSSSRRTPFAFNAARVTPQSEGFNVTPTLDSDRAVTQILPVGGGTVTATGADGTKFTLIVPVNALLSSVRVTMTPVRAVGGLPLSGGLAAAVQIEPAGLRLFEFATLVIEPAQSVPASQETSFAWDQAGDDFHLFPMLPPSSIQRENGKGGQQLNPRSPVFNLLHFSGYGIGSGTDADRAAQQQRHPSDSEAQFEQSLEAIMGRERKRQLSTAQTAAGFVSIQTAAFDEDPGYADALIQLLKDGYTNQVKPAMDSALLSKDDRELLCAMQKALGWSRQVELLLGDEDLTGKTAKFFRKAKKATSQFLETALGILAENSSQRCSKDHKPEEIITLLGIARQQQLLGLDSSKTVDSAQHCAHFELEFDSETDLKDPAATVTTHVHATVPIGVRFISIPSDQIPGQAPIEYLSCQWIPTDPDCTATSTTTGSTFRVISFNIDLNPRTIGDCNTATTDGKLNIVSVVIDPGLPSESIKVVCKDSDPITLPQVVWSATFGEFHSDEEIGGAGALTISGWEPGDGALLARKTYSRDGTFDGQYPMTERTTINLWHRPE